MTALSHRARLVLNTFTPQRRAPDPRHAIAEQDKDLTGKTVVFTVQSLYEMGANVVLLCRTEAHGREVVAEIASGPGGAVRYESCDLSSMDSVRACADRVRQAHDRIDILVNCAGANFQERRVTSDGFEINWAVNYLGPFLLTKLLLPNLLFSDAGRIVCLSSETEAMGHLDFDDLQQEKGWSSGGSYAQAKLAVNMFVMELAASLQGTALTVNALNPGFIQSNLLRDLRGVQGLFRYVMRVFASPPEVGADRIVRLAVSSEYDGVSGKFVSEDTITAPNPEARVPEARARLMSVSEASVARWWTPATDAHGWVG